jgi:tripartite-type tricarboxylate transporter receptor subunit TctC
MKSVHSSSLKHVAFAGLAAAVVAAAFTAPKAAFAQGGWPTGETIRIVVPYAAGSNGDATGRVIAQYLGTSLPGATIIVENRPGAGGIVGTRSFTHAAPDGYTLCVCSGGAITIPSTEEKMYDPLKDLVPISRISTSALVLLVNPSSPATTVDTLVAWSKAKPASLNYGSSGVGGIMYNAAEIFRNKTGANITHVPFRGGPDSTTALIARQIDLEFAIMSDAMGQLSAKTLRAIAVTPAKRSALFPDVPTMMEEGVHDYDIALWNGLFAPPGTPQPIIEKLSAIMLKLPDDPVSRKAMANLGQTPAVSTPGVFAKELADEAARWEADLKNIVRN